VGGVVAIYAFSLRTRPAKDLEEGKLVVPLYLLCINSTFASTYCSYERNA